VHQRWNKLGVVYPGPVNSPWARSHAALPVPDVRTANHVRVFFSSRDAEGRAQIGAGTLDLAASIVSLTPDSSPVVTFGGPGAFDESGVTSSCLVRAGGATFLYYTGWTRGVTVPFYFYIGLAISEDDKTFRKYSLAPIVDRSGVDPFLTASPWVLIDDGLWRMWYVSAVKWAIEDGRPKHYYHVRYAESTDGIAWRRPGTVCIDFSSPAEYAIGRPCVIKDGDGTYRMWYSYRGTCYRIGYAESSDGIRWRRLDDRAGIDVSSEGWDSEMNEYPAVFDCAGRRYMLYNGNGYGLTGIGLAVLDPSHA
jgi:hypothetical protein